MHVFIDDSGDPGFKIDRGSSSHFVIAIIIFDDSLEIEKTAVAIKELKRKLKFPDDVEFKFFKTNRRARIEFFKTVNQFQFKIRCIVVDKSLIKSDELKTNKNSFYSYFIKEAIKHNSGQILDAKIKIDGHGDRIFRKSFLTYLRRELNNKDKCIVKNCKLIDSKSSVFIQMADMVAGSINRSYNPFKKDSCDYREIIEEHIKNEWKFK